MRTQFAHRSPAPSTINQGRIKKLNKYNQKKTSNTLSHFISVKQRCIFFKPKKQYRLM